MAESYDNYKDLANVIIDNNTPTEWEEWAKKLYKTSEEKVDSVDEILDLAYSIANTLEDNDWALDLYERAMNESDTFNDMLSVADAVVQDDMASNDWAKEIYQKAYSLIKEFDNIKELTEHVSHDMYLGDKEWGRELFEEAKQKASYVVDFISLIEFLNDDSLDDIEYAKTLANETLEKCDDFDDVLGVLYAISMNDELRKEFTIKAIEKLQNDDEKNKLFEEIEYALEDDPISSDIKNLSVNDLKSKYCKPSTEELKKLYAAGIGDGSIEPVETSFDSFVENYEKDNSLSESTDSLSNPQRKTPSYSKEEILDWLDTLIPSLVNPIKDALSSDDYKSAFKAMAMMSDMAKSMGSHDFDGMMPYLESIVVLGINKTLDNNDKEGLDLLKYFVENEQKLDELDRDYLMEAF